jgi:hypothetical protein
MGLARDLREHVLGIAHVRHHLRVREARHLDDRHAQRGEAVGEPHLGVGIDPLGQALQAVARGDVHEEHLVRDVHGHVAINR